MRNRAAVLIFFALFLSGTIFAQEEQASREVKEAAGGQAESAVETGDAFRKRTEKELSAIKSALEKNLNETSEIARMVSEVKVSGEADRERISALETVSQELEVLKSRINALSLEVEASFRESEKNKKEFDGMKEELNKKTDKFQSWDDILDVLKKEMQSNDVEIARIKKTINDMKGSKGSGEEIVDGIISWPYMGVTALIVSIAALIAAVAM